MPTQKREEDKKQQQNRKNVYQLQTAAILRAYKSITQSTAGKGK